MTATVEEQGTVPVAPAEVYALVADPRRLARLSPECFAVWVTGRTGGRADRFVGWNRRGPFVWFTTCRVVTAEPGQEYAFDVTTFGLPVSRWGYRFVAVDGGTEVTEYWQDRRTPGARRLSRIFTGRAATRRPEVNRSGMRTTLDRLRAQFAAG